MDKQWINEIFIKFKILLENVMVQMWPTIIHLYSLSAVNLFIYIRLLYVKVNSWIKYDIDLLDPIT